MRRDDVGRLLQLGSAIALTLSRLSSGDRSSFAQQLLNCQNHHRTTGFWKIQKSMATGTGVTYKSNTATFTETDSILLKDLDVYKVCKNDE
jgi:hypothetical protein